MHEGGGYTSLLCKREGGTLKGGTDMIYESDKKYSFYYHYMHYYPSCIVKVECEGCLIERTLELLKKDPMIVISDIKEIDKGE